MFGDALTYPFRGGGWVMILTGTILAVVLDVAAFAPLFGVVAAVFSAGYFAGFYLDIAKERGQSSLLLLEELLQRRRPNLAYRPGILTAVARRGGDV